MGAPLRASGGAGLCADLLPLSTLGAWGVRASAPCCECRSLGAGCSPSQEQPEHPVLEGDAPHQQLHPLPCLALLLLLPLPLLLEGCRQQRLQEGGPLAGCAELPALHRVVPAACKHGHSCRCTHPACR